MTGSSLALVIVPIVALPSLAGWILMVYFAAAHPGPTADSPSWRQSRHAALAAQQAVEQRALAERQAPAERKAAEVPERQPELQPGPVVAAVAVPRG
jgi:hypothetical protein